MDAQFDLEQLDSIAEKVLNSRSERIFAMKGELGAGKTTLIKMLCKHLGVTHDMSSPSFGLINEYDAKEGPVYHFDLYRTKDPAELMEIGLDEYLDSGAYCFIEWPEVAAPVLEHYDVANVELSIVDSGHRSILITN